MGNDTVVSMSAPARVREIAVVGSCGIAKSVRDLPGVDVASVAALKSGAQKPVA